MGEPCTYQPCPAPRLPRPARAPVSAPSRMCVQGALRAVGARHTRVRTVPRTRACVGGALCTMGVGGGGHAAGAALRDVWARAARHARARSTQHLLCAGRDSRCTGETCPRPPCSVPASGSGERFALYGRDRDVHVFASTLSSHVLGVLHTLWARHARVRPGPPLRTGGGERFLLRL